MSMYKDNILDNYKNPKNYGEIRITSHKARVNNPLCGDDLFVTLSIKNKKITDIKFKGEGCAISIASASILTQYLKGRNIDYVYKLDINRVRDLLGIYLSPNRLKCALLSLEGIHKALKNK